MTDARDIDSSIIESGEPIVETYQKRAKGRAVAVLLNMTQERELHRLIEYERALGRQKDNPAFRCAFPHRPENDLQAELIDAGALGLKSDPRHGNIVVISSAGYSYFPEMARHEAEQAARQRREVHLIGLTALFSALCMAVGFLLGFLAAGR